MKRKYWLPIGIVLLALTLMGGVYLMDRPVDRPETSPVAETQCQAKELVYYYLDRCSWCQKVKNEGTLSKIEELGVKVKKINADIGPIGHSFQGVPTFVIDNKVHSGYKTFQELKKLLGC